MLFNSYIFLFFFLPVTLVGFYILERKQATLAKVWLTCFSLWFYGYFNLDYLIIMVGSIILNYVFYMILQQRRKKWILAAGIFLNLIVLFYFKYYDFFLSNVNAFLGTDFVLKGILLPLGISFFTFQQISFLIDTYRGELKNCSFLDYSLFVSFFPQLIAGPIVVHDEMLPQFDRIGKDTRTKDERSSLLVTGIYVFVMGLVKKVILADTLGLAVDAAYSNVEALNGFESLLIILFYSLQLYFDFSGYCDMARGIAGMFGMTIANNFNSPYKAVNIIDFWKKWHITLSRFFTNNIYIPLGGNRKGKVRTYINIFIIFFLSGLWHGAGWNFILWSVMHGLLYIITKIYHDCKVKEEEKKAGNIVKSIKVLFSGLATFIYVTIAWVYFRATDILQANTLLTNVYKKEWALPGKAIYDVFNLGEFWYPMKILKITSLPYSEYYAMAGFLIISLGIVFLGKNVHEKSEDFYPGIMNACMTSILFLWCIVSLSGVSSFLYFNF